jgi:phage gp16-like protein
VIARAAVIKLIHVAKRELAVEEESYRDLLKRVTGKMTCSTMTEAELDKVLTEFRRLGFQKKPKGAKPSRRAGGRAMAMEATARKIRALWLSLWNLGELEDASEAALAAFVQRITGIEALQWIDGAEADKVIDALLGWQRRIGLDRVDALYLASVDKIRHGAGLPSLGEAFGHKVWLIHFQWERLGTLATLGCSPVEWFARHFGGHRPALLSYENADRAIERLGALIRKAKDAASR